MNDQPEKDGERSVGGESFELREVQAAELKATLKAHELWCASGGKDGGRANLRQSNLLRAVLSKANLLEANFSGANLSEADLWGANLSKADLGNADLRRANLQQADLCEAQLPKANLWKARLTGAALNQANLSKARLWDANLSETDLGKANLSEADLRRASCRDASLVQADLSGANLSFASFRNADLSDAKLSDVTGLQAHQLTGANLSNAKLPPDIAKFDALDHVAEISKHARSIFLGVVGACVYSWLTIATTTDVALITGSTATPLPIIQTPVSISGFYAAAPAILFVLYVYLHLYLQRMWEGMAKLPAIFPDGTTLDSRVYPWLLSGLVSAHVPMLKDRRPPSSWLQVGLSIIAAWGIVPFTLLLFWGRYLVRHDWPVTSWHILLFVTAAAYGLASYRLGVMTLGGDRPADQGIVGAGSRPTWRQLGQGLRGFEHRWVHATAILTVMMSLGAIEGSSKGDYRNWRSWVPSPTSLLGIRTSADLREANLSTKPSNWTGLAEQPREELEKKPGLLEKAKAELGQVKGAPLEGANLRGAVATRAFLAIADLERANLQEAVLRLANLQEANLSSANLQGADLTRAKLQEAVLRLAILQGADLSLAKLQEADLGGAELQEANLSAAKLQGADLSAANLQGADLRAANLQGADLTGAILLEADLRRAKLQEADFSFANLSKADLRGVNLRDAKYLDQAQLGTACGDEKTKLPPGLTIKPCPEESTE